MLLDQRGNDQRLRRDDRGIDDVRVETPGSGAEESNGVNVIEVLTQSRLGEWSCAVSDCSSQPSGS
jgi:hypothetical protein